MKQPITLFFILAIFFSVNSINAQTWDWARGFLGGGTEGLCVCTDDFGNSFGGSWIFDTGAVIHSQGDTISHFGGYGIAVAKYDSSGNLLWMKASENSTAFLKGIVTDAQGNLYVLGVYSDSTFSISNVTLYNPHPVINYGEYFLLKYSASGVLILAKNICAGALGEPPNGIAVDKGRIYIYGLYEGDSLVIGSNTFHNSSVYSFNIFIASLDTLGNVNWAKTSDGKCTGMPIGIAVSSPNNIFFYGYCAPYPYALPDTSIFSFGSLQIVNYPYANNLPAGYIGSIDSSGNIKWIKSILCNPTGLAIDKMNNAYIIGSYDSSITIGGTILSVNDSLAVNTFLAKVDSSGSFLWAKGIVDSAEGRSVCLDPCGNIWVCGSAAVDMSSTVGSIGGQHFQAPLLTSDAMFFGSWDTSGNYIAASIIGCGGDDWSSIASDSKGKIYIVGDYFATYGPDSFGNSILPYDSFTSSGITEDFFVAKYSPNICTPPPTIVANQETNTSVSIFPNPTHRQFTIHCDVATTEKESMQLYNMLGQLVYTTNLINTDTNIPIAGYPPGLYICKVLSNGQALLTKKIEIEN